MSRARRELCGATAVDRSRLPPVPRGGCEDGGLPTIRRPLDVTRRSATTGRGVPSMAG